MVVPGYGLWNVCRPFWSNRISALVLGTAFEDIIAKLVTDDVVIHEAKPVGLN
jgi:hypothetical protein